MIFYADTKIKQMCINAYTHRHLMSPYKAHYISSLGGFERASLIIKLSLDIETNWTNGIIENSRFLYFRIDRDGTIELFCKSHKIERKFRKVRAKSLIEAINKINTFIQSIN